MQLKEFIIDLLKKNLTRKKQTSILGIDEIAQKKGHGNYINILYDIAQSSVIDVLPDRKQQTLQDKLEQFSDKEKEDIDYVCIDMNTTCYSVIKKVLPDAEIVIDRFHIQKYLNKALKDIKIKLLKSLSKQEKEKLKHIHYALLNNDDKLTDNQEEVLNLVYEKYPDLAYCHELKEWFSKYF